MGTCASCQAELQPQWKFCIRCGAAVVREPPGETGPAHDATGLEATTVTSVPGAAVTVTPAPAQPLPPRDRGRAAHRAVVPGAIRPDPTVTQPRRRIDVPLIAGIALGVVGIALIVYMVIVLGGSTP